ncbi:MAG TPA: hypothetical protein VHZ99_11430 [Steroidobacteraceae bacterium]|jgi:hypothetical protein|nr:hypothetical protein [Steroidobacteraceae bacterium]
MRSLRAVSAVLMAISVLTACGSPQEPARHAVEEAQSALASSAPQANRFVPDRFATMQGRTASLQASYDHGDFKQVLNDAPTLLNDIQAMRAAASARQAAADKVLAGEWDVLAGSIPGRLSTVQERIDALGTDKKEAAKVDVNGARASLNGVDEQWSHAQEVFNAGDLTAAVEAARGVQQRIDAAAKSLKLALPETARS